MERQNLIRQINFLASQNKLLEQMNDVLIQQNKTLSDNEVFVDNLECDEMRSGFFVTSHRKKLWNVQIGLINEFARICKKYNLRWFADSGTLLGAARHKGFIPWDDDVDVSMLRPDYNKFVKIAAEEIKYPYFFDNWYNHRLESDEVTDPSDAKFPFITNEQRQNAFGAGWPFFPAIKIRDSRTTMIEIPNRKQVNQGIWIDIFPLDGVPPFAQETQANAFEVMKELLFATTNPDLIVKALNNNTRFLISNENLKEFIKLPFRSRGINFENYAGKCFRNPQKIGEMYAHLVKGFGVYDAKDYEEIVYLPFEGIEIPAPAGYDNVLTSLYGNWHEMKITHTHAKDWSADIPYTEYYKTSALMR